MQADNGIGTLLDLNGNIVQQEHGYWVEIHAWRVEPTVLIPHGIRYALTLHEQSGERVMGYDNAHAVKSSARFKYASKYCSMTTSTGTFPIEVCLMNSRMLINCYGISSRTWIEY